MSDTNKSEELAFRVVYVSGDDNKGEGDDQKFADPDLLRTKPWTSNKYCHYPQEMVMKFKKKVTLEKIQVLSHSIFVPQKVELFVGNPANGKAISMTSAKYKRLGFVGFQNNKDEKSRELKSIYVDASGYFLKFLIHENYKNQKKNPYDQVGIMKISVIGFYQDDSDSELSGDEKEHKPKLRSPNNNYPVHEDKSYSAEMREIQKILEQKKKKAVGNENFELAKNLKVAIDRLKTAQEDIDKLDRDKREAVEEEDFDKAQNCKEEIEGIRSNTYSDIRIMELLTDKEKEELGLIQGTEKEKPAQKRDKESRKKGENRSRSSNESTKKEDTFVLPSIESNRRNSLPYANSERDPEESRLPPISPDSGETDSNLEDHLLDSVPNQDRGEVSHAINVFGIDAINNLYSKKWEKRKLGLEQLEQKLEEASGEPKDKASYLLMPALQVLKKGLKDKVFQVYSVALGVLRYILGKYLPHHKIQKTGGKDAAERTHYVIITRTGDSVADSRFRQSSIDFLDETVKVSETPIGRAYVSYILRPFQATGFMKIDQGHAEIAEKIVVHQNAPNEKLGLDEHRVCGFALSCIQHTDPDVRQAGARIMIYMYSNGDKETVRQYLPPEGSKATVRNPLFKALFDELDIIDGKPPRSQQSKVPPKGSSKNPQQDENIKALQRQNLELKEAMSNNKNSANRSLSRSSNSTSNSANSQRRGSNSTSNSANRPRSGSRRRSLGAGGQRPSIQVSPPVSEK